mgnify:FL=1
MGFLAIDKVAIRNLFGLGIDIRWYGILIALGVAAGIGLAIWDAKRRKISTDVVLDMTLIGVICAIVFARLYYVIFDTQGTFANDFMAIFRIWDGGLAIYGGVIGGALGIFVYSRIKKLKLSVLFDIAAPSLAIGQAIGRWGNFINQEAFGQPVTDPGWQWFPYATYIENPPLGMEAGWYQATFFYESMWCLLLCLFLVLYRRRQKFSGEICAYYFLLYGIERAGVELLRTDQLKTHFLNLPVSHLLSLALVAASLIYLIIMYTRVKKGLAGCATPGSIYYVPVPEEKGKNAVSEGEAEEGGKGSDEVISAEESSQEEQPQEQGDNKQADEQGDAASSAETNGPEEEQDDI